MGNGVSTEWLQWHNCCFSHILASRRCLRHVSSREKAYGTRYECASGFSMDGSAEALGGVERIGADGTSAKAQGDAEPEPRMQDI